MTINRKTIIVDDEPNAVRNLKYALEMYPEINIIGQDITAYGMDIYRKKSLAKLFTSYSQFFCQDTIPEVPIHCFVIQSGLYIL